MTAPLVPEGKREIQVPPDPMERQALPVLLDHKDPTGLSGRLGVMAKMARASLVRLALRAKASLGQRARRVTVFKGLLAVMAREAPKVSLGSAFVVNRESPVSGARSAARGFREETARTE